MKTADTGSAAVVAVLLPREHLPYIRDWCKHHCDAGFSVVLYDNSGSVGSLRQTSAFHPNWRPAAGSTKSGARYGAYSAHLTDDQVSQELLDQVAGLPVTVIPWRPRDAEGRIVHGQVEAYVDFIRRASTTIRWAAFIDADEYLTAADGMGWPELLDAADAAGYSRIVLSAETYQERWSDTGEPRPLSTLTSRGSQVQGNKNLVRIGDVERADIHWSWTMTTAAPLVYPDERQYYFKHYNGRSAAVPRFTEKDYGLVSAVDESVPVWTAAGPIPVESPVLSEIGPVARGGWNRAERDDGVDLWTTDPSHVIRLDALATVVYELCDGRPVANLVETVAELYATGTEQAREPVEAAITSLLAAGLVL